MDAHLLDHCHNGITGIESGWCARPIQAVNAGWTDASRNSPANTWIKVCFMEESSLISAARRGDLESFNQLVLAYQDLVYHQAYRLLGERRAAEDAAQEAFVTVFRKLGSYRGGSFKVWLLRIVTNRCYDQLRWEKRHPAVSIDPVDSRGEEIESPSWLIDPGETPESAVERTELRDTLQAYINQLPVYARTVLVLVDIQGLDYSEAAAVMGVSVGTVKSRLARARKRIRDCLKGSSKKFDDLPPRRSPATNPAGDGYFSKCALNAHA
ncbi:MAG TPA: sigma-70 family RNA polymerase sigma factor [Anaerolineales bacterium]|nr:sigma-70 family RNA polymerase sigma factor [Anaerolineales bacterium]